MNRIYLIGVLIGSLEVMLVTFLTSMAYFHASWWGLGLLAYFLYCFAIGATLKPVMVLAVTGAILTLAYVRYGLLGAIGLYALILFIVEFIPALRQHLKSSNNP
ncbi:hypothetical protein [Orrella marina]|uniref:Uncharacterized protein n=1 Tax=Orrella marina TaxID=2163011 RepID=A0A2R4XJV9_9BURK|nr:hypothetical protein [Orrella marina]AWB34090.1 hypothetical protein DBV39_10610 [Orrella marina]